MRKSIGSLSGLLAMLVSQSLWAGGPGSVGSSTITVNWTSSATAVPLLGMFGTVTLALLVVMVVMRAVRKRPRLVRMVAPVAGLGLTLGAVVWVQDLTAGISMVPNINAASCSGSQTYTADGPNPPPCFINTCGAPVTVSYTFVSGVDGGGSPLTAGSCTFDYYCDDAEVAAEDGALIPSDGAPRATAYCQEIFSGGPLPS